MAIAYGIAVSIDQITFNMLAFANEEAIGIRVGKYFGANNPAMAKQWFMNALTTIIFIDAILIAVFVFLGKKILILVGFDPVLATNTLSVIYKLLPSYVLSQLNFSLAPYLYSVETDLDPLKYIPLLIVIIAPLTILLALTTSLGFWCVVIALTTVQVTNLFVYLWMYFRVMNSKYRGLGSFLQSLSTLGEFVKEFCLFWLGLMGEYFGWELSVYFAVLTKDNDQIAAVTFVINVAYYVFNFGSGHNYKSRSTISALIGAKKKEAARKFTAIYFIGLILVGIVIGCTVYLCSGLLARMFTQPGTRLRELTTRMFKFYAFWAPEDIIFYSMLTTSRILNLASLNIILNLLFVLLFQTLISLYLHSTHQLTSFTVLSTTYSMFTLVFIILGIVFIRIDWMKIDAGEVED